MKDRRRQGPTPSKTTESGGRKDTSLRVQEHDSFYPELVLVDYDYKVE